MAIKTVKENMTYKIQIDDLVRDANADEIAAIELQKAELAAQRTEAEAKAEAKLTAQSKLAALGLTVEDLTALGL
jgi:hypothetical protein